MPEPTPSASSQTAASLTLYNLVLPVGLLVALPGFLLKMFRRGGYGPGFGQRFGRYANDFPPPSPDRSERPIWIHAVSVGEVLIARKLIAELRRQSPGTSIVLSTTTSTGHRIALENESSDTEVIYNPLDLPWVVNRAMDRIRPQAIVLVEAEVWPNLVLRAVNDGIPVLLANARLSPRSERRYRKFHRWVAPVFGVLNRVCVQELEDVNRWARLGVAEERIRHTGSIKFDQCANASASVADDRSALVESFRAILHQLWGNDLPHTVLLASSHDGEETNVGKVILTLRQKFPELKFLVAPRHFERADAVERDLRSLGLTPWRRSAFPDSPPCSKETTPDTLIIDTTGELSAWQALPDLVVIGKSFLSTGGQNPVEAIAAGTPVITGPHMENFAALMALLLKRRGILQVDSIEQLGEMISKLLEDRSVAASVTENGRNALGEHSGATRRTIETVLKEL